MKVCVDTVILIDILKDEFRPLQEKFYNALYARERLLAPVVVFAELMPQFGGHAEQVTEFLAEHKISVAALDLEAVRIAGSRWFKYLKHKTYANCPSCGQKLELNYEFRQRDAFKADLRQGAMLIGERYEEACRIQNACLYTHRQFQLLPEENAGGIHSQGFGGRAT